MEHILDLYKDANIQLENFNKEKETLNTLVNNIQRSYEDRISALKSEMTARVSEAESKKEYREDIIKSKEIPYHETINKVKHTLDLLDILNEDTSVTSPIIYWYSDRDEHGEYLGWNTKRKIIINPIQTIIHDKYSHFNLYIVPNKKPKNKFSLIIRGYSIFGSLLRGHSFGSIYGIREESCNFYITVKEAPTEKELMIYTKKYMNKIMSMIPKEFETYKEEYEEATEFFRDIRWQIFYWRSKKYYYEHGVSRGTEDPEYSKIINLIRELELKARA